MNPRHDDAANGPSNKKPQIGRREIGALLLLEGLDAYAAAGLQPAAGDATPPAEPATLVAS